jgi:hypothetical protein
LKIRLKNGIEVILDAEYTSKPSYCRSCCAMIYWAKTLKGKFIPLDKDLKQAHYISCPNSDDWRKNNDKS